MISGEHQRKLAALRHQFPYFAANVLKIRTKTGALAPLELNAAQVCLHSAAEKQKRELKRVRLIVLKGRQQGISTYIEGRLYWRVTQTQGARAFILTHESDATSNLFDMAQRFYLNSPEPIRPPILASNSKELVFDRLDAGYKIGTAGTKGVGRSSTVQYFHGSEVAFWPHAETHLAGVLQAVPLADGTEIYLESTANGVGGVFHEYWLDAMSGKSEYRAVFIPWYLQPEYRANADGIDVTAEETELAKLYGLDTQQLAWRRTKIRELKGEDKFKQEYPCTASEAFLFSGRSVFDVKMVDRAERECFSAASRVDISPAGSWTKRPDGALRVWDEPKTGLRYVIGADVAEGLAHGDYSCAEVLEAHTGNQVAEWHGHIAPDLFGDVLYHLARRYNNALLGIERNNHGLTTITRVKDRGYQNLYAQEDIERTSDGHQTKKAGWLTTSKSKYKIIDQLAGELRDGDHGIVCAETVAEMRTYVIHDGGEYGAAIGLHDDRVMARAIAGEMLRVAWIDPSRTVIAREYKPADPVGWY